MARLYFIDSLKDVPQRMDKGEDFSKGIGQAQALVNNPNVTPERAAANSRAC